MPIQIKLPEVVSGFECGTITSWIVKEGDNISVGDILFEVETDKAVIEVESKDSGILGKILIDNTDGEIPIDTVIGLILAEGETVNDLSVDSNDEQSSAEVVDQEQRADTKRIIASPVAKRIAAEHQLDLSSLTGSGPRNRILKSDVEKALKNNVLSSSINTSSNNKPINDVSTRIEENKVTPKRHTEVDDSIIPHSAMRKVIANRLSESKSKIPHFYLSIDCNVENLNALRTELNCYSLGEDNFKLTVNDLIIKAVACSINKHPQVNSMWLDEGLKKNKQIDISIAVSTDNGLMTPIVFNADQKGLATISKNVKELALKTRNGKLQPHEYQGGGFTISNLGMYEIDSFSAIINPPQSCILAVAKAKKKPVVKDDEIIIANMMNCTLSVDHRVIDGALAAEFLQTFKHFIEEPKLMMLHGG
jgi:pyruvate dehydrogenase E2 component (dihydrolipoamide acetyltransferase)